MTNDEIFLEFWKNYVWPEPKPVEFRLYHDQQGRAIEYSMQEREGEFILITAEEFARRDHRARVVNGRITFPRPMAPPKLVPGENGTACHSWSVAVVSHNETDQRWSLKTHESN